MEVDNCDGGVGYSIRVWCEGGVVLVDGGGEGSLIVATERGGVSSSEGSPMVVVVVLVGEGRSEVAIGRNCRFGLREMKRGSDN
ncbi:hypothetical protein L1987_16187 [Smallanthus sonchifolius]|uniref:Uncharacterized protein n=1 Tax=Smallanthus sonchifolius TaxID=185202 RepID=A0ACB9J7J3_9ASTR|nr:hypothetical protein L1987_16187 [Smallanthus sonchifolius]